MTESGTSGQGLVAFWIHRHQYPEAPTIEKAVREIFMAPPIPRAVCRRWKEPCFVTQRGPDRELYRLTWLVNPVDLPALAPRQKVQAAVAVVHAPGGKISQPEPQVSLVGHDTAVEGT